MYFPDWSPHSVIDLWEYTKNSGRAISYGTDTLLFRLLTYPDMENVWAKIGSEKAEPFAQSAILSWEGPTKEYKMTKTEREKWQKDIKETAIRLADLLEGSCLNPDVSESSPFNPDIEAGDYENEEYKNDELPFSYFYNSTNKCLFSDSLRGLAEESQNPLLFLPTSNRPNDPKADRAYFIKFMSIHCVSLFGKPKRDIVARTTATAFDQPEITERQVIRLTSDMDL